MATTTCTSCGSPFDYHDELPRRGSVCFRCHIQGISLGFAHGKADFHGPTFGERGRKIEAASAARGMKVERVGERWV